MAWNYWLFIVMMFSKTKSITDMATKIGIKNQTLNSFGCIYYIENDYTWLFVNPYRAHSWYKERVLTNLNMIFVFHPE
jgi:hypothetical protein